MATTAPHRSAAVGADQRRTQRTPVTVALASVRDADAETRDAQLLDLSIYGCRVALDHARTAGDRIWLRFASGWPIAATVVWASDDHAGCRFDEPIPASLMRDLTRALH